MRYNQKKNFKMKIILLQGLDYDSIENELHMEEERKMTISVSVSALC